MKISKADIDAVASKSDRAIKRVKASLQPKPDVTPSKRFPHIHKLNKKQTIIAAEVIGQFCDIDHLNSFLNAGMFSSNPFLERVIAMKIDKVRRAIKQNKPKP